MYVQLLCTVVIYRRYCRRYNTIRTRVLVHEGNMDTGYSIQYLCVLVFAFLSGFVLTICTFICTLCYLLSTLITVYCTIYPRVLEYFFTTNSV